MPLRINFLPQEHLALLFLLKLSFNPQMHTHPFCIAGLPYIKAESGTFFVTTEPAPIVQFLPRVIPVTIVEFAPIVAPPLISVLSNPFGKPERGNNKYRQSYRHPAFTISRHSRHRLERRWNDGRPNYNICRC